MCNAASKRYFLRGYTLCNAKNFSLGSRMASISQQGPPAPLDLPFRIRRDWVQEGGHKIPLLLLPLIFPAYLTDPPSGSTIWEDPTGPQKQERPTYKHAKLSGGSQECSSIWLRWSLQPNSCRRPWTTGDPNPQRDWLAIEQLFKIGRLGSPWIGSLIG